MSTKYEHGFEQIKVSSKLDEVVENAINIAIKDKKRKSIKGNVIKCSTAAASIFMAFILSVNCIPAFAQSIDNVPILSSLAHAVKINYSSNIGTAIDKGYSEEIKQSKTVKDIGINITNVVADDKNLYIMYTLDGTKDKQDLKNILISNLQITDSKDNILVDTDGGKNLSQILTNTAANLKGNVLIPLNSHGYSCVLSTLDNSLESYSEKKQTMGVIQISADNNKIIPEEIKLNLLGFTEAYNMSYSKEAYNNFISKFNRKPINVDINCSFNIKTDKKLSSLKPESYSNIKFSANDTDFELKKLTIYPTYIEAKIQLGKSKLTNAQCIAVINKIGLDNSSLPYLVDENGTKYMPHRSHVPLDSDNCQTITFESSYFNQCKELYLVINQFTYINSIVKDKPVKVKIK